MASEIEQQPAVAEQKQPPTAKTPLEQALWFKIMYWGVLVLIASYCYVICALIYFAVPDKDNVPASIGAFSLFIAFIIFYDYSRNGEIRKNNRRFIFQYFLIGLMAVTLSPIFSLFLVIGKFPYAISNLIIASFVSGVVIGKDKGDNIPRIVFLPRHRTIANFICAVMNLFFVVEVYKIDQAFLIVIAVLVLFTTPTLAGIGSRLGRFIIGDSLLDFVAVIPYIQSMVRKLIAFIFLFFTVIGIFSIVFGIIFRIDPHAYSGVSPHTSFWDLFNFSLMNVSTLGDTPVSPAVNLVRFIVYLEWLAGALWFLAVFSAVQSSMSILKSNDRTEAITELKKPDMVLVPRSELAAIQEQLQELKAVLEAGVAVPRKPAA